MQLLITGGTGLIGRALVQALQAEQWVVTVISRQPPQQVQRYWRTPVKVLPSVAAVDPGELFDAVINLAGEGIMDQRWSPARKQQLLDSRVGLTTELVDLFERMPNRPRRLISGSAIGYYGDHGADQVLTETHPPADDFAASLCQRWEQAAQRAGQLGIPVTVVRTGIVLDPNGGALAKMLPVFRLGLGGVIGNGQQMMSWIHRADMVRVLLFLLTAPEVEGVYNAVAPNPVSNWYFVRQLASVLRRPALLPVPALALRLALGESAHLLSGGQAVYPQRLLEAGFAFDYPDLSAALAGLLGESEP